MIPYGKQCIDDADIQEVINVLKSDFITTGPKVDDFEKAVAEFTGAAYAVAVSNGTAALHAAVIAAGIQPGDEVIVTPISFVASANCIVYAGATPVFADVIEDSLLIDPEDVKRKITDKTKAIIAVDFAGQPCDYDTLQAIAAEHKLTLIADGAHSIGAEYHGRKAGTLADLTTFSFHPVKHITTGEGGMILTDNADFYQKMKYFRNHGITTDYRQRQEKGAWFYEMKSLGYNYRITDIQCALGISQLKKLPAWINKRQQIAKTYDKAFEQTDKIVPLKTAETSLNAYHLYVIKLVGIDREAAFNQLREKGIGVNVHYIPIHYQPFYRETFNTADGMCPVAEKCYQSILSLPLHPGLTDNEINYIIENVCQL